MPKKNPETQAFIDEMAAPSVHSAEALRAWSKACGRVIRDEGQQLAKMRGLLHEAERAEGEGDGLIRGKLETIIQQLDAQARIIGTIATEERLFRVSRRLLAEQMVELHELAAAVGYKIPVAEVIEEEEAPA